MERKKVRSVTDKIYVKDLEMAIEDYKKLGFYITKSNIDENNMRVAHMKMASESKVTVFLKNFHTDESKRCSSLIVIEDPGKQTIDFNEIDPPNQSILIAFN